MARVVRDAVMIDEPLKCIGLWHVQHGKQFIITSPVVFINKRLCCPDVWQKCKAGTRIVHKITASLHPNAYITIQES